MVSAASDRSGAVSLEGATLAGNRYVFIAPDTGITRVSFYFDNPNMTGTPSKVENVKPYDFNGTASNDTALAWNTAQASNGAHSIKALISLSAGGSEIVSAGFSVNNP
jgi:hypothetical protein